MRFFLQLKKNSSFTFKSFVPENNQFQSVRISVKERSFWSLSIQEQFPFYFSPFCRDLHNLIEWKKFNKHQNIVTLTQNLSFCGPYEDANSFLNAPLLFNSLSVGYQISDKLNSILEEIRCEGSKWNDILTFLAICEQLTGTRIKVTANSISIQNLTHDLKAKLIKFPSIITNLIENQREKISQAFESIHFPIT